MSSGLFKKVYKKCVYKSYIFNIYMYKEDLALNNLQKLICHKTKPNQITNDILLWTPTHGHVTVGQPVITYLHQPFADTGYSLCSLEDLLGIIDDRDG